MSVHVLSSSIMLSTAARVCLLQTKRELIVSEYHTTEQQFVEAMQMLVEVIVPNHTGGLAST